MNKRIHIFRLLTLLTMLLCTASFLHGQAADRILSLSGLATSEADGVVRVSFVATVADDAVGRNKAVVFVPVLTDGYYAVSLPAVAVEGQGVRRQRRRTDGEQAAITAVPGETIRYSTAVEAQAWMHGSRLLIESVSVGCGVEYRLPDWTLSENLRLYDDPQPVEVVTEVRRFVPRSMADSLSVIFPFVLPESLFDPADPYKIYDRERNNSLIVYFHQAKHVIDVDYRDNAQTLRNLTAVTEMILADPKSRVERVVVAGFTSPEGNYDLNDRLAFNRAVAVKHYLLQNTGLRDEQVWLYNGAEDWRGLRLLVEQSDIPQKQRVLDILLHTPNKAERLAELKRLDGGAVYGHLFDTIFPLLRNGAFIKVYYSNQ